MRLLAAGQPRHDHEVEEVPDAQLAQDGVQAVVEVVHDADLGAAALVPPVAQLAQRVLHILPR